jgi:hypothetical protein
VSYDTAGAWNDDAPFSVIACDLDGDGDEDLATTNDGSDTVSILLNDSAGRFGSLVRWAIGPTDVRFEPVDLTCCDLDGDGRLDLITSNRASDNISILYNAGNVGGVPQFSPAAHYPVGEAPWAVRCARIDDDAHVDIVTANLTSDSVSVLINDGQGGISGASSYSVGVGDAPRSMAVCDIDGDTDLDVVTGNVSGKSVTVFRISSPPTTPATRCPS